MIYRLRAGGVAEKLPPGLKMEMLGVKNGDVVEMLSPTSPFCFLRLSYSVFIFFYIFSYKNGDDGDVKVYTRE